jgi:hypothetical protein
MTDAMSHATRADRDLEAANPAYLYKGPLTPRRAAEAAALEKDQPAKTAGVFGLTGIASAMQVCFQWNG